MQCELNLPPIIDYIKQSTIFYGAKLAKTAIGACDTQIDTGTGLQPVSTSLTSLIKGDINFKRNQHPKIFHHISMGVRKQNVNIFNDNNIQIKINPCYRINAKVHLPIITDDYNSSPIIRKTEWLKCLDTTITNNFNEVGKTLCIYTDGSQITSTGRAGAGFVVYEKHGGAEIEHSSVVMPTWTSTTHSELFALKLGVKYATDMKRNALILCDSLSALQSINSSKAVYVEQIIDIQNNLILCAENNIVIQFMWVPSHIGIQGNERADQLAKAATKKSCVEPTVISTSQFKTLLEREINEEMKLIFNSELVNSCSLKHHENFLNVKHRYGKGKLHTGSCDRIAARIRLGYRNIWEINFERTDRLSIEHSKCYLCGWEKANKLEHYITTCQNLKQFRPKGMQFHELCHYFCEPENLYPILTLYPSLKIYFFFHWWLYNELFYLQLLY